MHGEGGWQSLSLTVPSELPIEQCRALRRVADGIGADLAVTGGALAIEGPALVVCDVDATFMQGEAIDHLAERAGAGEAVAAVTARAMQGDIAFAESLRLRVEQLAGLSQDAVTAVAAASQLTPGAADLVRQLHSRGAVVALASGGFLEIIEPHASALGITRVRANRLDIEDGALTGRVLGPVIDAEAKAEALRSWTDELKIAPERTVAVGDGANDLHMLAAAGLGVAFRAKPIVQERADAVLTMNRLDALLGLLPPLA